MQLETYISDLLYRYDCVTIPDFGAFLTHRVSAKIHESTHTFYPPKKALSFNEQLQNNDGLLANYIAEVEKIPYATATLKISKKVKSIKSYLVEGETLQFKNIGELTLNADGKMVFNPSKQINYLTDSFGLSHFTSSNVTREVYKATVEDIQEATFVISNPLPAATLSLDKQTGNYHIVAGAFRVEANSDKKVNQLRSKGYKARKIGTNRYGLHEVVYASFETRAEAQRELYKIRREHNRDAWLLIKRLK